MQRDGPKGKLAAGPSYVQCFGLGDELAARLDVSPEGWDEIFFGTK